MSKVFICFRKQKKIDLNFFSKDFESVTFEFNLFSIFCPGLPLKSIVNLRLFEIIAMSKIIAFEIDYFHNKIWVKR